MRKFTKLAAVLGLTLALSINTFAISFKDVAQNHWAYPGISYMQENGYMTMNSSGQFLPNDTVDYFQFSELLAKLTGYQDEKVNKDMDPALKESIRKNYEKQLPVINQYDNANRYKTWYKPANEEIAYILGRGYLKVDELSKFMIKGADGKEYRNVMTKEELAVLLVRYIGKEKTAIETYKATGFSDEAQIKAEYRPHVAYLKNAGLIAGDTNGKFNPKTKVTRALCATMTTNSIKHKESLEPTKPTNPTTPETNGTSARVDKVVAKDAAKGEYFVLLEVDGKTRFYTVNQKTAITDQKGNKLEVKDIEIGGQVKFVLTTENNLEYVKSLQLQKDASTGDNNNNETGVNTSYTGEVGHIGRNNDLTLYTSKGAVTFVVDQNCNITLDGTTIKLEEVKIGDEVTIQVSNGKIIKLDVIDREEEKEETKTMSFVSAIRKLDNYYYTVIEGGKEVQIEVDQDATIYRNDKKVTVNDLRIGDKLTLTLEGKVVTRVEAESEKDEIKGKIKKIIIAQVSQVVIDTKDGEQTVAITSNTDMYDKETREDATIRDLKLGMDVEIRTESKEALSLVIQKAPSKITYKGTISQLGAGARYIDVLVEYDQLTGETMTIKRINVPSSVKIIIDKEEGYRNQLEEEMEVLITYTYGEELYPQTIEVLN